MTLNLYGDQPDPTAGGHGTNIATQRMDELDISSLEFALADKANDGAYLDIGCGLGVQGIRFALLNKNAWLYDIIDISSRIDAIRELLQPKQLIFVPGNVAELGDEQFPPVIKCLYLQRFISFLPYGQILDLLKRLRLRCRPGTRLYTTAGGLHSKLGNGYLHRYMAVEQRFHTLAPIVANQQNMTAEMCLHTEADMAQLLTGAGFNIRHVFSSPFGNIKAEAET